MKRPKIDPGSYYTLTEAARATGIPRGVLDHGCRSGRLPFRQTESGTRLLAGDVVAQLARDHDLRSFPKAYESPPGPAPNLGYEQESAPALASAAPAARAPNAADRLGLLGEPSPELKRAKEQAEAEKLKAEKEEALLRQEHSKLERSRLQHQQQGEDEERRNARAEELKAKRAADAESLRLEEESRQQAERERLRAQERARWTAAQFNQALREMRGYGVLSLIPYSEEEQVKDRIQRELASELEHLNPMSPLSACAAARRSALATVLNPFRCNGLIRKMFFWQASRFNPIRKYLDKLNDGGWLRRPLDESQRQFLAERWEPEIKERIRREYDRRGGLTEGEAQVVLEHAVDDKVGLGTNRRRPAARMTGQNA